MYLVNYTQTGVRAGNFVGAIPQLEGTRHSPEGTPMPK
jgi:hypothetical protein